MFGEFLQHIQILEMVAGEHLFFDEAVEIDEIEDHAGVLVNRAADGNFQRVVVAMSVRVVALAVGGEILGGGHFCAVQAVG